ncbi:hypothetical protein F511_46583 [Dorcoceras hygrometricum]|uniref:Uncharacterized protein n=1 Tax=Dorcoceras hygrometricum TaxID=472368 RepID=A0A2Z6ZT65_9LAMI|nr:hypothetical protein F511_46583 [Dorcoceras hygrometricum]
MAAGGAARGDAIARAARAPPCAGQPPCVIVAHGGAQWPAASRNLLRHGQAQRLPSCRAWRGQRAAVCRALCDGGGRRHAAAVWRVSGSVVMAIFF